MARLIGRLFAAIAALALLGGAAGCDDYNPNQRLAVLDIENGRSRTISPADRSVSMAVWSPDSQSLLVQEGWAEGRAVVRREAVTGRRQWEVSGAWEEAAPAAAAFSPDGERVALLRFDFVGEAAGSALEMLDSDSGETRSEAPVWSVSAGVGPSVPVIHEVEWMSDGRIAVLGVRGSLADLFILDPSEDWAVTTQPTVGHEGRMSASPKGGWIAVLGDEGLVLHAGDGTASLIRDDVSGNVDFAFSPDGMQLVLASNARISVYDIAAGTWITVTEAHSNGVAWSPSGLITWASGPDVLTMLPDGSERAVVVHVDGGKSVRHPEWSPDGTKLAYVVEPPYRD